MKVKKLLSLILVLVMLLSLVGCERLLGGAFFLFLVATDNDDRADKDVIIDYVLENEEELRNAIEKNEFSEFETNSIIKEIDAADADTTVIDFYCGGAGFGPSTAYVGFYYTPDNDMTAVWCAPASSAVLSASGDGFVYQEPNSDNRYYTERICENFYYYESSF